MDRLVLALKRDTPEIILQPNGVVLAKVAATLDLDKDQLFAARIFDPVGRTEGNIHRVPGRQGYLAPIEGHLFGFDCELEEAFIARLPTGKLIESTITACLAAPNACRSRRSDRC